MKIFVERSEFNIGNHFDGKRKLDQLANVFFTRVKKRIGLRNPMLTVIVNIVIDYEAI